MNDRYENNKDWSDSSFMDAIGVMLFFGCIAFVILFVILLCAKY